jgi:ACS family hexuronate transporter-like MFS transporter
VADNLIGRQTSSVSVGWFRWVICALLFFATTLNYIDRAVIGILKPELSEHLKWSEIDYANIVIAFNIAYAIGYSLAGWFMDRVGVKKGFAIAVLLWSLAEIAHAFNWYISPDAKIWLLTMPATAFGFCAARFVLGVAEGGNFPASAKTVSIWFPKKERALATGIFNSGSNVGALAAPLLIAWLAVGFNWPMAFIVTGAIGLVWLIFWLPVYTSPEKHKWVRPSELKYIYSDPPDPPGIKIPWRTLLKYRQTWMFVVGTGLSGPIWWFWLYWIPDFLHKQYGLNLMQSRWPLVVIYLMTSVGSIGGGWLSGWFLRRGWTINAARKTAMLICALCVVPVFAASMGTNLWIAVILVGLAASAHQGFVANLITTVSDTAPRKVVGSIVGLGGSAAAIGGMFIASLAGFILEWTGQYLVLFIIASGSYLVNLLIMHLINPHMKSMEINIPQEPAAKR